MNYLALGDSISIDDYTGVPHGGAVRQFARLIGAQQVEDWTRDGCTTEGVMEALRRANMHPNVVTLTAGGNDLLVAALYSLDIPDAAAVAQPALRNLEQIASALTEYRCPVIINTIYDPTNGDDSLAEEIGIATSFRAVYNAINAGIRALAERQGFLLSDLETLFQGHGINAIETWIVGNIEPNYAGATAIARHWQKLYAGA